LLFFQIRVPSRTVRVFGSVRKAIGFPSISIHQNRQILLSTAEHALTPEHL
jgi:hypothetical protein